MNIYAGIARADAVVPDRKVNGNDDDTDEVRVRIADVYARSARCVQRNDMAKHNPQAESE